MEGSECSNPLGIGDRKIDQRGIVRMSRQKFAGLLQRFGVVHGEALRRAFLEIFPYQSRVAGVVLEKQQPEWSQRIQRHRRGKVTSVSQNSSIACTTRRNWLRSTGFFTYAFA